MTTIRLIISPQGQTRLETRGFAGASCREASAFLEQRSARPRTNSSPASSISPSNRASMSTKGIDSPVNVHAARLVSLISQLSSES